MKSEAAGVETLNEPVLDERNSAGTSGDNGAVPYRVRGGHQSCGLRRSWVTPWVTTSNSASCPYYCEGYEFSTV
jgi:hypothetical protein